MSDGTDVEIIYCVVGKPEFRPILLKSIESFRGVGFVGPIAVLSDLGNAGWEGQNSLGYEVRLYCPPRVAKGFGCKTLVDKYSSANKALVVDCDIVAVAQFDELWTILKTTDFAICRDVCPTLGSAAENDLRLKPSNSPADIRDTVRLCGIDAPYFNGGVFAYRRTPRVLDLFAKWHEEWKTYRSSNQYPLLRALKRAEITPTILGPEYNADARWFETRAAAVAWRAKIVHFFGKGLDAMMRF